MFCIYLCVSIFIVTQNAHSAATFTKDARRVIHPISKTAERLAVEMAEVCNMWWNCFRHSLFEVQVLEYQRLITSMLWIMFKFNFVGLIEFVRKKSCRF
jgi:hypothetical protein